MRVDNVDKSVVDELYTKYIRGEYAKLGVDKKHILLFPNFVDKDHLQQMYEYIDQYRDDDSVRGGNDIRPERVALENPEVHKLILHYQHQTWLKMKEYYVDGYGVEISEHPTNTAHFVKWVVGMRSPLHADCERPDGTLAYGANFYMLNFSALIYINDDYEGGHIAFPAFGVDIKPKPGDLIIFPSTYRHEVTEITAGTRYTMPSFYNFLKLSPQYRGDWDSGDSTLLWVNEGESDEHLEAF